MNTAVNAVVQLEPFKLFYSINEGIRDYEASPSASSSQTATVGNLHGRSQKPAGIAQLGYVCFWPNGGGLKESNPFSHHPEQGTFAKEEDDSYEDDGWDEDE